MQEGLNAELHALHLIDRDVEQCWAQATHDLDASAVASLERIVHRHEGELRDPGVWAPLFSAHGGSDASDRHLVILLTTNNYTENWRHAVMLRGKFPAAFFGARTFERTALTAQIESGHHIDGIYIAQDLRARIISHWLPRLKR